MRSCDRTICLDRRRGRGQGQGRGQVRGFSHSSALAGWLVGWSVGSLGNALLLWRTPWVGVSRWTEV